MPPFEPGELGELGLDGADGVDEVSDGVLGVELPTGGLVVGEADGFVVRSLRSPTRSDRDSVQPATKVTPSASAQNPASSFFITYPPLVARAAAFVAVQSNCHRTTALDTLGPFWRTGR